MEYTFKNWQQNDIYNCDVEFNRIEGYNQYVENWLKTYYNMNSLNLQHKTNWTINDIPDLDDFNRIKRNINRLIPILDGGSLLNISLATNYALSVSEANEIENALKRNLQELGNMQFSYNVTGLAITSNNNLKLGGVN